MPFAITRSDGRLVNISPLWPSLRTGRHLTFNTQPKSSAKVKVKRVPSVSEFVLFVCSNEFQSVMFHKKKNKNMGKKKKENRK